MFYRTGNLIAVGEFVSELLSCMEDELNTFTVCSIGIAYKKVNIIKRDYMSY